MALDVFKIGPAAAEGGITASTDSVWLFVDKNGSLARIDPASGTIRQTIKVPPGSYNPFYADGEVWVTRADGSEMTAVDAVTGVVSATALSTSVVPVQSVSQLDNPCNFLECA
jgi:streptogramin lyase